jgi:hypothetical protein
MHVRAVVRAAMAAAIMKNQQDYPLVSVPFADGPLTINGVSDANLDNPSVARIIKTLIENFRSNPRRLGFLDFVDSL